MRHLQSKIHKLNATYNVKVEAKRGSTEDQMICDGSESMEVEVTTAKLITSPSYISMGMLGF